MTLRRKTLLLIILFVVLNGMALLFWVEAAYLFGEEFDPQEGDVVLSPYFSSMILYLFPVLALIGACLYWAFRRLVIAPINDIAKAAEALETGRQPVIRGISRGDEIGRLTAVFNRMAGAAVEAMNDLDDKIGIALSEAEKKQSEIAMAERLAATGRLASDLAVQVSSSAAMIASAMAGLRNSNLLPEKRLECVGQAEEGLRNLRRTVLGVFEAVRRRKEVVPVSAGHMLRRSVEIVRPYLEGRRITLTEEIEGSGQGRETRLVTMADPGDLQYVFANLLLNAIDAMPRGGGLTVRASRVLNWVLVEIIDTGVGLTIDELSASFDYYHSTKGGGEGLGLGLSVSQYVINGYGGALTLNSRKGEGTKATVELPAAGHSVLVGDAQSMKSVAGSDF